MIVAGHSQGGGAALASHALGPQYAAPDLQLAAVVAFAGTLDSDSVAEVMRTPLAPIIGGLGVVRAVVALVAYADFANLFGQQRAREGLHADIRDFVGGAVENDCIAELVLKLAKSDGASGYSPPLTLGGMIDPDFRKAVVACLDSAPSGCTPDAQAYVDRAAASVLQPDGAGAPVLLIVGEDDAQVAPNKVACTADLLAGAGVETQSCVLGGESHLTIVDSSMRFAIEWAIATANGQSAPACPAGPALPSC